jgi:hypothetical protein
LWWQKECWGLVSCMGARCLLVILLFGKFYSEICEVFGHGSWYEETNLLCTPFGRWDSSLGLGMRNVSKRDFKSKVCYFWRPTSYEHYTNSHMASIGNWNEHGNSMCGTTYSPIRMLKIRLSGLLCEVYHLL